MLGWLYLRASAPPTGIYKRFFCCSSATFGTLFPNFCAVGTPLFFNFPKLAFFWSPHSMLGSAAGRSTPPMAKLLLHSFCCRFSCCWWCCFFCFLFVFHCWGFSGSCFLPLSRRRRQRWPLRRQPPRGRGRWPKCPPFSRACFRAAKGQQAYGIQNTVLVLWLKEARDSRKSKDQKQSVALNEEYTKKTKMKTTPVAPGPECKGRASGDETKEAESSVLGICCPFIISQ